MGLTVKMSRRRTVIPMKPSRVQGVFLRRFEEAYFSIDGRSYDTLAAGEDGIPGVPRGTYKGWRRQLSSPTIRDMERLCALAKTRQTLLIDPSLKHDEGADDMSWRDEVEEQIARLAALEPMRRGAVLEALESAIDKQLAKEGARNPSALGVVTGGTPTRRS